MFKILPYSIASKSARDLARALGVKRIIPNGGYHPGARTVVLNWGNSQPGIHCARWINKPSAVAIAAHKLRTFEHLTAANVRMPKYTTDPEEARRWLSLGKKVVARTLLQANSGEGIVIVRPGEELVPAPLYTMYVKKEKEFRVHVFAGRAIDVTEKRRKRGSEPVHPLIRNHKNGWVFCRDGIDCPSIVTNTCIAAVMAVGLDFGAVDVILRDGKAYVLEVNCAPGIEGSTLDAYVRELRRYV